MGNGLRDAGRKRCAAVYPYGERERGQVGNGHGPGEFVSGRSSTTCDRRRLQEIRRPGIECSVGHTTSKHFLAIGYLIFTIGFKLVKALSSYII
jgi:hypothetical protein